MKSSISCAIVRDLMPTYLDKLTSDETNKIIEEHIEECEECSSLLNIMKEPKFDDEEIKKEKIEINFLKKNKKKTKDILAVSVIVAAISIIAAIIIPFFIRQELAYEEFNPDLTVGDVIVDGKNVKNGLVSLTAKSYGTYGISRVDFSEENGVVTIKVIGARNKIFTSSVHESKFSSSNTIKTVKLGGNIIWENGVTVSDNTLEIYKSAHPYVGDPSQNGETLSALKIYEKLGEYTMELHTGKEPYGMTVVIKKPVEEKKKRYLENYMGFAAYNCLAVIDNLSYVNFKYELNGVKKETTWDLDKAKQELGKSIKEYGKSEVLLESLKWDYNVLE